ncbi:MAG TPA: xanthine dehydrogenase family protein molybdopterin-binding subunit [Actinomycetota bacterium]|nr:xanthine dehydrogenase family protein molybdopterin-binding subunit [Actinomycetota bacterium]
MTVPPSTFGIPALRTEDPRFLRGEGRYVDNIEIPGALRAVFVRSIFAHAAVESVEGLEAARAMPGVVGVYTAADLDLPHQLAAGSVEVPGGELDRPFERPILASERLRYVGEPYAVVVAESLGQALDAAELIFAVAEPLPVIIDPEVAATDEDLLFPETGTNVATRFEQRWDDDVLAGAEVTVRGRFVNQRVAPVPMEMNAIAVIPERDGTYTVWVSSQVPFDVRADLVDVLGVDRKQIRVIAPDVGGGFGAKVPTYPEYLIVGKAAEVLGRPVRWAESRSESMISMTHGRSQVQWLELGARRDGTITGLRFEVLTNVGAYPQLGSFMGQTTAEMISGVYAIADIAFRGRSVVTNVTPLGAYRGAGRPEAAAAIERAVDLLAAELEVDAADVRRKNLIPPDAFPFRTAAGTEYDSGDYLVAFDRALEIADYSALRAEQAERRARGDRTAMGIGLATYVEITGFPTKEFARVDIEIDGTATAYVGTTSFGQGHETAFAQLVGGVLGLPHTDVRVVHSDTALVERGQGSWGSRSLQAGGSVLVTRADEVVDRARALASVALEADVADVEGPVDGGFRVIGAPERTIGWRDLAAAAEADGGGPLSAKGVSTDPGATFPFGAHVAVVDVDLETGDVRLSRLIAVDDCGRILNPMLVRGQQHGGLAQGVAQALFEEVRLDEAGNPITSTLMTYLMPSAAELPAFECDNTETLTPVNPLGAKGIGESGSIGSTPAVQNAVVDALSYLGVRHVDLPCSPERVWSAIAGARAAATAQG